LGDECSDNSDTELYCICNQPDDGRAMTSCDKCEEWFHCECVGITIAEAKKKARWSCPKCDDAPPQEVSEPLWCVCKQPNDSTFYLGCDACHGWFHPSCLNMTQRQQTVAKERGELWRCPACLDAQQPAKRRRRAGGSG
jgi:hypothetical protein